MNAGRVIAAGDIHSVLKSHDVIEAYLGNSEGHETDPPSLEIASDA
jgi:hypothetical protein